VRIQKAADAAKYDQNGQGSAPLFTVKEIRMTQRSRLKKLGMQADRYVFWDQNLCIVFDAHSPIS
jgi:hypothetical protein